MIMKLPQLLLKALLLLAVPLLAMQAADAQVVHGAQRKVYRKVSGDSLQLRSSVKAEVKKKTAPPDSAAKPKKAKVDSLKYSPRQYMLGERIIMRGDSGRDVRSLANILVKKLYMDERDIIYTAGGGVLYDGELVKAVKRFQRLNGFHEDGIVGHGLIKALRKRSSGSK